MVNYMGVLFEAVAYLKIKLIFQVCFVILLGVILFITVPYGLIYAAAGLLGSAIMYHAGYIYLTKKLLSINLKEIISIYFPSIITSIITGLFILLIHFILIRINSGVVLLFFMQFLFFVLAILLLLRFSFAKQIKIILSDRVFKNIQSNIIQKIGKRLGFVK